MKATRRKKKLLITVTGLIVLLGVYSLFIEPRWVQLKKFEKESPDVPQAFKGLKIIFLTDIHYGPYYSRERLRSLVARVNGLNPDIVLLGGDYLHRDTKYIRPLFEELKELNAPLGKYGVLGNHDHWGSAELCRQNAARAGIKLLDNKAEWIYKNGERIRIGGVGDLRHDRQDLSPTINDAKEKDFVILLSHNPDFVKEIDNKKIDLVLSGHTHGGQVTLFGLWAPVLPVKDKQFRTGIVKTNNTEVLISNGIGNIMPPVRFFARPQIWLIELK